MSGVQVNRITEDTRVTLSVTYGRRTLTAAKTLVGPADPNTVGVTLSHPDGGRIYGGTTSEQFDLRMDGPAPEGGFEFDYRIAGTIRPPGSTPRRDTSRRARREPRSGSRSTT